jgi:hypothetical protein
MALSIKNKVFKNNNQFIDDGFKLDLTYITDNVIGMSYPASALTEKFYRNDIKSVKAFFTARHPGCYHVYNMSNRPYDPSKLDGNVSDDFVWHDHHSPALTVLFLACKRMFEFVL